MGSRQRTAWGTEIARLLLRSVIGATMIAHGVRHGRTLDGTAGWFEAIGFQKPRLQAKTSALVEIGAGAALIVGAGTPLAAAAVVGTMAVAEERLPPHDRSTTTPVLVSPQRPTPLSPQGWRGVAYKDHPYRLLTDLKQSRLR
jgi:DoxX